MKSHRPVNCDVMRLSLLEQRVEDLRLLALETMRDSVTDFFGRVKSHEGVWSVDRYPTLTEKELYAQFGHILLPNPRKTISALLALYDTIPATNLTSRTLHGKWRAYRVSTRHLELGSRRRKQKEPLIFPGAAGQGGITDVVLLLNPSYPDGAKQIRADLLLYFELKSRDHHRHQTSQMKAHLAALSRNNLARNAFLASVGGKPIYDISHRRWLGHATLDRFFEAMMRVTATNVQGAGLARDIKHLWKLYAA